MKAAGTVQGPAARRRIPIVPVFVAAAVLIAAMGMAALWRVLSTDGTGDGAGTAGGATATTERPVPVPEDWGFVLDADAARVLRHRPGLTPKDFIRTHAFGWDGPTVHEVWRNPVLIRELRMQPGLSVVEVIRAEARGS